MSKSSDYTPRLPKSRKGGFPNRPTPQPPRREHPGRASSRPARKGRFLGSKAFWRLAAVVGLIVLVGVPVLADLMQGQVGEVNDFDGLAAQGDALYNEGLRAWESDQARAVQMFARAADSYERALALRPSDAQVRTALGRVYYSWGWLEGNSSLVEKAVQTWQIALSYEPNQPETLLNLGIGYAYLGRREEAAAVWQKVIEVAPDSTYAQEAQGLIERYGK